MQNAFDELCQPGNRIPTILVGGTNGKGSVCGFLAQFFAKEGRRVGLYTSPHLISVRERIWFSHKETLEKTLEDELNSVLPKLPSALRDTLSFFELLTLVAFRLFSEEKVDVMILEVGMGGRWDATNVCSPSLTIINEIGFDHTEYLGNTLEKIAAEKLGICRPGVPLFWGMDLKETEEHQALLEQFERKSLKLGFELKRYGKDWFWDESQKKAWVQSESGLVEKLFGSNFDSLPQFLKRNFLMAHCAFENFKAKYPLLGSSRGPFGVDANPPSLIGRFDERELSFSFKGCSRTLSLIFDVCHNLEGLSSFIDAYFHAFLQQIRCVPGSIAIVTFLNDKPFLEMLKLLGDSFKAVIVFSNSSSRSIQEDDLISKFPSCIFKSGFPQALQAFIEITESFPPPISPIPICGSVAGVGEALSYLSDHPTFELSSSLQSKH